MQQQLKKRSLGQWVMFGEAWILLHVSRLAILLLPFRWLAPLMGREREEAIEDSCDQPDVLEIKLAIDRAARRTLFNSRCFDQALTAASMLRRRKKSATLFLGVSQQDGKLSAHAWVSAGKSIITGSRGIHGHTPVAHYRISGPVYKSTAT